MRFTTDEPAFGFRQGHRPLLISMPHVGTHLPPQLARRPSAEAQHVPDTDWHLERLYVFADALGASVLVATYSRYVIDLNRPPDGASLYPGRSVTGVCPVDSFDDALSYRAGDEPDDAEIAERREAVWQPYHRQLEDERASRARTAKSRSGMHIRSARACRASSQARCPTSTSAFERQESRCRTFEDAAMHRGTVRRLQIGARRPVHRRPHHSAPRPARSAHARGAARDGTVQLHAGSAAFRVPAGGGRPCAASSAAAARRHARFRRTASGAIADP